jgi:AraC-like DNA-binding protein
VILENPITIENYYDVNNSLMLVNKGEILINKNTEVAKLGDIVFIPSAKATHVTFGRGTAKKITNEEYFASNSKHFEYLKSIEEYNTDTQDSCNTVKFEAKIFDSVNFFSSVEVPAFIIKNDRIASLITDLTKECLVNNPGRERIIKITTENIVVEFVRHIIMNKLFVEKFATNTTYFKDPRLIDIFNYIKQNLNGNLSNKALASVAHVSEDYVGQYFKMLTGINPQDYIEYQRMEAAVQILRTTKKSIRDVGREVGYKDTAYFCRRFKMMFGISAGKMRRREVLLNN